MLNNEDDVNFHSVGIDSLVSMWYDYPFREKTSEMANSHYYEKNADGVENWTELREPRDWSELKR